MVHLAQEDSLGKLLPINKACIYKDIFIVGLNEDELIYSNEPFYIQNSNGEMVGVDQQFSRFYIMDSERNITQKLLVEWTDQCSETESVQEEQFEVIIHHKNQNAYVGMSLLFILILVWSVLNK